MGHRQRDAGSWDKYGPEKKEDDEVPPFSNSNQQYKSRQDALKMKEFAPVKILNEYCYKLSVYIAIFYIFSVNHCGLNDETSHHTTSVINFTNKQTSSDQCFLYLSSSWLILARI